MAIRAVLTVPRSNRNPEDVADGYPLLHPIDSRFDRLRAEKCVVTGSVWPYGDGTHERAPSQLATAVIARNQFMVSFDDGLPWLVIGAIAGASLHWWIETQSQTAYWDEKGHPIIWIAGRYERLDIQRPTKVCFVRYTKSTRNTPK